MRLNAIELTLLISLLFIGCSMNNETAKYKVNGIPYEDEEENHCGLLMNDGRFFYDSQFEERITPAINNYFAIEDDNGLVLCKIDGDSFLKIKEADSLSSVGVMSDGLIPVCKDYEHIQVLDLNGKLVYQLDYIDDKEVIGCFSYSCGIMRIVLDDFSHAYLDRTGKLLFGKSFDWGTDFNNGFAVVNIEDESYALINELGDTLFSFECSDKDNIIFSTVYKYLATSDNDDRIIIYNFEGEQIKIYPSKVKKVCYFCKDAFVFENYDEYGLMEYSGKELIRAKYEILVPNGDYFLAIHDNRDEEILVINKRDEVIQTLDGEEIGDISTLGFDYPLIIERSDDEIYLIDSENNILGHGPKEIDVDLEDFEETNLVGSHYFPEQKLLNKILELCGGANGLPNIEEAFFTQNGKHCHINDIRFLRSDIDCSKYKGQYFASKTFDEGFNYRIDYKVHFDEPIVKSNETKYNASAWLKSMQVSIAVKLNMFYCVAFYNLCKHELLNQGYSKFLSNKKKDLLISKDKTYILIMECDEKFENINIYVEEYNDYNINKWNNYLSD